MYVHNTHLICIKNYLTSFLYLGPSLLDLTNSNPLTRVQNSEFRSLQGLRNALKNEINRGMSRARVNKVNFLYIHVHSLTKVMSSFC